MQVFEKIKDDFESKSVMMATSKEFWNNPQSDEYVEEVVILRDAIEIVDEVAKEYQKSECGFISKAEILKFIEDIKCNDDIPKNYGTLLDIMRKIRNMPTVDNDGWIPCSERMPEEKEQMRPEYDPVTLAEVDVEHFTASELVNVTVKDYDSDEVFTCDDCTVDGKWVNFCCDPFEVLAWKPLPHPYQTKGE